MTEPAPSVARLFDADLERLIVAAVLADPQRLASVDHLAVVDLADFQAIAVLTAIRNVQARSEPVSVESVRAELIRSRAAKHPAETMWGPDDGLEWFSALARTPIPAHPPVTSWALRVLDMAIERRDAVQAGEPDAATDDPDVDDFALRDAEPAQVIPIASRVDFERDERGRIYCSQANIQLALTKLGITLRHNEFAHTDTVAGLDGFGSELTELALNRIRLLLDSKFRFRVPKDFFLDVILDRAQASRFHPVRDYLDRLAWDGVHRIGDTDTPSWLTTYAGAADTRYTRAIGRIVLTAAVRRIRQPGCKFDEMLILEGHQGKNKSTALAVLAVEREWFNDDIPLDGDTKRQMESTMGRWIVEAGELRGMSNVDYNRLKAYLGRTDDEARLAYARKSVKIPRQHILIGTTNEEDGYLRDPTGGRRQWPVWITEFLIDKLRADRDQLWAEASAAERRGESIRLAPELYGDAAIEQESRRRVDPILVALKEALGDINGKIRIVDCYAILDINPAMATQDQMTRVGQSMRELGWDRSRRRFEGDREYAYVRGEDWELKEMIMVNGTGRDARVSRS